MDGRSTEQLIADSLNAIEHLHEAEADLKLHQEQTKTLWELRHRTADNTIWCAYRRLHPAVHLVTVTVDEIERFREQHSTEADAYDEAAFLLDHFMLQGWTNVTYHDPRISSPFTHPPLNKSRSILGRHPNI